MREPDGAGFLGMELHAVTLRDFEHGGVGERS